MKSILKDVVARTANSDVGWFFYRGCGKLSHYFGRVYGHARFVRHEKSQDEKLEKIVRELFPTLTVANGPFEGLRYPAADSCGSMLLPKLLGSYESELRSVLERILTNEYTAIVDIGCAEGYYAVGLGLRIPRAQVYAFDTSQKARAMCADMADLNGLQNRIHISGFCDEPILRSIPLGERALIVSDCEGYENVVFGDDVAEYLKNHDLIIETHDFLDIDISTRLNRVFSKTHEVETIRSMDDIQKAHTYVYPELERFSTRDRFVILSERRPATMEWLVVTARRAPASTLGQL